VEDGWVLETPREELALKVNGKVASVLSKHNLLFDALASDLIVPNMAVCVISVMAIL